jgi:hypothetical protein
MGALLALRPDFDTNQLKSQPAKIIAQAMKNYGAYLVDDAARDCFALPTAWEATGRVRQEFERAWGFAFITNWPVVAGIPNSANWLSDLGVLARNLYVISNNDSNNIGGGPTSDLINRRAPIAPDISGSTRIAAKSRYFIRKADNHTVMYSLSGRLINQRELDPSQPHRDLKQLVPFIYIIHGSNQAKLGIIIK